MAKDQVLTVNKTGINLYDFNTFQIKGMIAVNSIN